MRKRQFPRGGIALGRMISELYRQGQIDYSLEPVILSDTQGNPLGRIRDGDSVIFCCRRGEREIQLTEAFTEADFNRFSRPNFQNLHFVILTLYHEKFKGLPVAFAPSQITDTLGEVVSDAGLRQLHIAESEKFAHVTFFFNGGNHRPFKNEQDVCIPSRRDIPFDQIPELSLAPVTGQVLHGIENKVELIVVNFANGDVIGHTSNNDAKIKCASIVDAQLGRVIEAATAGGYVVFVTADHGNLEEMINPDGSPHVAHTANPVKFILVDPQTGPLARLRDGRLADVAPSVLSALGLDPPCTMEGKSLVDKNDWGGKRRALLIVLDGWGIGGQDEGNPIFLAPTPHWDELIRRYPNSQLQASGDAVGLQAGKAGNSEAGHMNLGAGRLILQDDVRLDLAMRDGSFYTNEIFCQTLREVKRNATNLHLISLLTEKSSHGSIDYPLALLRMAKKQGLERVYLHVILDGRSTAPGSAPFLLEKLERNMDEIGLGLVVSGMGRGIALDRDGNYGKTRQAFDALVSGRGKHFLLEEGDPLGL